MQERSNEMKNRFFLSLYMIIMGAGLAFTNYCLNTPYTSEEFGRKFMPVTATLAVIVLIYGSRHRKDLEIITDNRKGHLWFLILFVPVTGLAIYSAVRSFDGTGAFFLVILDSLLVGIGEEGMFRGILLGGLLRKKRPVVAVLISAILFSCLHFLNLLGGVGASDVMDQMLSTFILGMFLGCTYLYTKNIVFPVLFHFAWDYIMLSGGLTGSPLMVIAIVGVGVMEALIAAILLFGFRKMPEPQS